MQSGALPMSNTKGLHCSDRPQLFVDDHLIEVLDNGASLKLQRPVRKDTIMTLDKPWEGNISAVGSLFKDGDTYRMYYRAWHSESKGSEDVSHDPFVCLAESADGIHWERPELGLVEFQGSKANNIILPYQLMFSCFKDSNPNGREEARYKGMGYKRSKNEKGGYTRKLYAYQSADGVRWRMMQEEPILTQGVTPVAFDTTNLAFWDANIGLYRAYIRDWKDKNTWRDIKMATSEDFLNWTKARWLEYSEEPQHEHYSNMVQPYTRNPELYLGFPTRYIEERDSATEPLFMSSRDGLHFNLWQDALLPPGRNPEKWSNRGNYIWHGLFETASDLPGNPLEISFLVGDGYYEGADIDFVRHAYRPDGFVSVRAGFGGGSFLTKPFTFDGSRLILNVATAAAGSVSVEIQDLEGQPIDGHRVADCDIIYGDDLERIATWKETSNLAHLQSQPIRLRFTLKDADLFALRFDK